MLRGGTVDDNWRIRDDEKSSQDSVEGLENNRLHHAIINGNTSVALDIIEKDKKLYNDNKALPDFKAHAPLKINDRSLGNTPLLLALKTGQIIIVKALLQHPGVDASMMEYTQLSDIDKTKRIKFTELVEKNRVTDALLHYRCYHGETGHHLRPLHWACMLRQNDSINLLLADPEVNPEFPEYQIAPWWIPPVRAKNDYLDYGKYEPMGEGPLNFGFERNPKTSPFYLYINKISETCLAHDSFKDEPTLRIFGAEMYTDIIFHMRSLCTHLGWAENINFSRENQFPRSYDRFQYDYRAGINTFMKKRNAIEIDLKIAEKLATTDEEKAVLKKLLSEEKKAAPPTFFKEEKKVTTETPAAPVEENKKPNTST